MIRLVGQGSNDTLRGDTDREVDGWHRPDGAPLIELQRSGAVGTASEGNTVLELDSTANSIVYRDISGLDSELTYTVSFDYSARPRVSEASNGIEVYWDGVLIFSDTVEGRGLTNFDWQTVSIEVPVTADTSRLEFRATGTSDSLGVTIDNVGVFGVDTTFDPAVDGGNDLIDGGAGDDIIEGGAGDDAIIGGEGADDIDGGTGGDAEGDTYKNVEFIHGSSHDDVLTGNEKTNRIVGNDGDDQLYGGAGNDTLLGGNGADHLDGGEGDRDVAEYDWSSEGVIVNLETGVGFGGQAEGDTLTGIEYIYGSYHADILTCRDAADYGEAESGVRVDLVNGGSSGEAAGDTYTGVEFVYGSNHDDVIIGDDANNRLVGADGDDQLSGGAGKDYLVGGEGADDLDGGAGTGDTAVFTSASSGVGVDLTNGGFAGEATGDTYTNIEYVDGSDFDDTIIGDGGNNRLIGQAGNDTIDGGAGNDYIIGMQDNDILTGGAGNDVFLYKSLFGDDVITDFEAGVGRTDRIWLDLDGITAMADLNITDTALGCKC
ncbi:Bifunctional hemolysin/adenylate cyclase [Nymphon striatum]|nr:Bifunctional hemolysin/adenylate cyclase [Nymphon striatum]